MHIPEFLKSLPASPELDTWLISLPQLKQQAIDRWQLTDFGKPFEEQATCSYVVPCMIKGEEHVVLKISWPHDEAMHEAEGMRLLDGGPSARLLEYDEANMMLLLERCIPGWQLRYEPEPFQDEVLTGLLKEIWQADYANGPYRTLSEMIGVWNEEKLKELNHIDDPELAKRGCELRAKLAAETHDIVFLATDLHAGNILMTTRRPWLVIDIKPYVGDRTYDLTQHLINCMERLEAAPKETIERVAHLGDAAPERLAEWMFARLATRNSKEKQDIARKIEAAFSL